MSRARSRWFVAAVVVALVGIEALIYAAGIQGVGWLVLVAGVLLVVVARLAGLSWTDLGFSPRTVPSGLRYGAIIICVVAVIAAVGVAFPPTRELFRNDRYTDLGAALTSALVIIPFRTVLGEELLFRGVLLGALLRGFSTKVALLIQALLFGLWHVMSSFGLASHNEGLRAVLGTGWLATVGGIALAVIVTGTAGLLLGWLRIRSQSMLAPIALHWAANGVGAIAAALAWHLTG